ncbi:MAG: hypothetical protein WC208_04010 [Gallionella sp.]|jgi:hypothetical protein
MKLVNVTTLMSLLLTSFSVMAGSDAKVFPVKAIFYDDRSESVLDARFRLKVKEIGTTALAANINRSLSTALKDKVGPLDRKTADHTFVVSFHVPRATSYSVDKGNGNSDLVAAVTASLYFTNVITGEILTTISRTVVSRAVIANNGHVDVETGNLYSQSLNTLITDLADAAAKDFSPTIVDARVTDQVGNMLVLDAGYIKGIQSGDSLNDSSSQLIKVVYAAESYSIAERVLADNVGAGVVFQKYMSHASDGKIKPRTIVLVETKPEGFSKEYIANLFSEMLGDKAPLSIIQVNSGFYDLLKVVVQQASLGGTDTANRKVPDLFIRLRVAEPIVYEAHTNLDFQKRRHYETVAFADIVDSNGRVNFSAIGKNDIDDVIIRNVGPGIPERKEVSIKNSLLDLAQKLSQMSELRREQVEVQTDASGSVSIASSGKVFSPQQKGIVLRKAKIMLNKVAQQVWMPTVEAFVEPGEDVSKMQLSIGLPVISPEEKVSAGNVFEVQRLGITPRSAYAFSVCGPIESLGNIATPSLLDFAAQALGAKMPGMLYAPSIIEGAKNLINPSNNFESEVRWTIPPVSMCVQPVERVTASEDKCTTTCERPIAARYTLRVKLGSEVVSRSAFESQFKTTDFYKETPVSQLSRLVDSDLIDEARILLDKAAEKVIFQTK